MPLYWFIAGMVATVAAVALLFPWIRARPRWSALPTVPWMARAAAVTVAAVFLGAAPWLGRTPAPAPAEAAAPASSATPFGAAAKIMDGAAAGAEAAAPTAGTTNAQPMDGAVANLEARLAKGGGSAGDWELLAKSFEFLGRPADAAKARAHQLPAAVPGASASPAGSVSNARGAVVTGEITVAANLAKEAAAGQTLFIVAKSVDTPGMPVAVLRARVADWPLRFTLDDSQSMMAGRNLSSAGHVTVEARISQKGQPLPSTGDLQGSSGIVDPAESRPLKIVIDHVVP